MVTNFLKFLFIAGIFISDTGNLFAQSRKIIMGAIVDITENQPVPMASITNITLGKTTLSRGNGTFQLEASTGNIIAFSANGFYADTISLKLIQFEAGNILLTLRPLPSTLTSVTVVGNYNPYQIDSIERRKSFMEDIGESSLPPISGISSGDLGFGVGINMDRWSKKEKRERKARNIFDMMEEEAYVNYRWNFDVVSKYTTYEEDILIEFIEEYRPEYQWLRKNPEEEALVYYINSALKKEKRKKN